MAEPQTFYDLECWFTDGESLFLNGLLEGRDRISADEARIRIQREHEPGMMEETIIDRTKLNYFRTTKRIVQPEPKAPDA